MKDKSLNEKPFALALLGIFLLLIIGLLCSCSAPKFQVITVKPADIETNTSLIFAKPINHRAMRMGQVVSIFVGSGEYEVGDTITITHKSFTNFK